MTMTTGNITGRHNTQAGARARRVQTRCERPAPLRPRWVTALALSLLLSLILAVSGCGLGTGSGVEPATPPASESLQAPASAETLPQTAATGAVPSDSQTPSPSPEAAEQPSVPTEDRAGNPISVPEKVSRIVSLAPSFTEMLIDMGLAERIVAIDMNAAAINGVNAAWPVFDMMAPDTEKLLALAPDVLLASPISTGGGDDPFKLLRDAGICVIYVPTSESIADIEEDLRFVGAVVGESEKAQSLVNAMRAELDAIGAIGAGVTEKKRVHFEISAAPYIYSFGKGVFLDEMLALIGAENVYADQESWIPVADEVALAGDPDVILTNVNYIPDAIGEIKVRPGWSEIKAVKTGDVYYIDNMASSLPNHNIVKALREMAEAVYPELY